MDRFLTLTLGPPGPSRRLVSSALVESLGFGAFLTVSLLYFTTKVGISAVNVAAVAAVVGLVAAGVGSVGGSLVDLTSPRRILVSALGVQAIAMVVLSTAHGLAQYTVGVGLEALANRFAYAARGAIMGTVLKTSPTEVRARIRAVQNVGVALGSSLGGVGLAANSSHVYQGLILANGLAFLLGAVISRRLPDPEQSQSCTASNDEKPRAIWQVHRDRRYLLLSVAQAALCVNFALFEVAMPLWVTHDTSAPRWFVSVVFLINTACVVIFQVGISRRYEGRSGTALLRGSGLYLVACICFGVAATLRHPLVAGAMLVLAAAAGAVGEMLHMVGAWGLSFDMAPDDRHGEYQSLFSSVASVGMIAGPLLVTTAVLPHGISGWVVAGMLLLLVGVGMSRLSKAKDPTEVQVAIK